VSAQKTPAEIALDQWLDGQINDDEFAGILGSERERVYASLGDAFRRGDPAAYFAAYCDVVSHCVLLDKARTHVGPLTDADASERAAQLRAHANTLRIDIEQRGREAVRDSYQGLLLECDVALLPVVLRAASIRCRGCGQRTTEPRSIRDAEGSEITFIECGCGWTRDVVKVVDPDGARQVVNLWEPS
jgi:hypothetical protein